MQKTIHSGDYQELVRWLKSCREKKGLSMRALADLMGVPHSWVGKVEQMERRLDVYEYVQLCKCLDVNPAKGLSKIK